MSLSTAFRAKVSEWLKLPKPEPISNEVALTIPMGGGSGRAKSSDFNLRNLIDEGYRRNVVVYCCVNEISTSVSEPRLIARQADSKEELSPEHPLSALLRSPNPGLSRFMLLERALVSLQTTGCAYIHKGRNRAGAVIRLTPLRPDRMQAVPDAKGGIEGWDYTVDGGTRPQRVKREDCISIQLVDPLNDYYGLPPLVVCAKFGDLDSEAALFMRDFFLNGGMPSGLLKLKTKTTPENRERVRQLWRETYGRSTRGRDASQWWNIAVLDADADYQATGSTPQEMRLDGVWNISESRICATFGVPPILVQVKIGMERSTYSNYETAVRAFWSETLMPMYARVADTLTNELAREFDESCEIAFDLSSVAALSEGATAKADRAVKLYAGGVWTLAEARKEIGADEPEVDMMIVPSGAVTIEELKIRAANPQEPPKPGTPPEDPEDAEDAEDADEPEDDEEVKATEKGGEEEELAWSAKGLPKVFKGGALERFLAARAAAREARG